MVGLPSEDRPPGASNGTFYDDRQSNGASAAQTPDGTDDGRHPQELGESSKPEKRRAGAGQRICGKCGKHLTGQFVRALGDTYHLECFTCHVSISHLQATRSDRARIAIRLSHPNSSQYPTSHQTSIHCARQITFGGLIYCATPVEVLCVALISQLSIASTTLNTSPAAYVQQCLAHTTPTTNTKVAYIVITTIRRNSLRNVMGARRPFSSSLWRSSAMAPISTGIQSAT